MIAPWVKNLTEEVLGASSMKIGKIILHPDGYRVKIISGAYWGTHGLSNWWTWRRVSKTGKLGKKVSGYGW